MIRVVMRLFIMGATVRAENMADIQDLNPNHLGTLQVLREAHQSLDIKEPGV
jgi:hypothetical protein